MQSSVVSPFVAGAGQSSMIPAFSFYTRELELSISVSGPTRVTVHTLVRARAESHQVVEHPTRRQSPRPFYVVTRTIEGLEIIWELGVRLLDNVNVGIPLSRSLVVICVGCSSAKKSHPQDPIWPRTGAIHLCLDPFSMEDRPES